MTFSKLVLLALTTAFSSLTVADVSEDLIAMDKQWGMAGGPAGFVAEDVIGIGPTGVVDFSDLVADAAANANAGEEYVVSGYQVKFLSDERCCNGAYSRGLRPSRKSARYSKAGRCLAGCCYCVCTLELIEG